MQNTLKSRLLFKKIANLTGEVLKNCQNSECGSFRILFLHEHKHIERFLNLHQCAFKKNRLEVRSWKSRGYIVQFTPHLLHILSVETTLMDTNLLHISLTKFNKLNLKRSLKINRNKNLISDFKNYFCNLIYIQLSFSVHFLFIFGGSFDLHLFPYISFDSKLKKCIVNCMC